MLSLYLIDEAKLLSSIFSSSSDWKLAFQFWVGFSELHGLDKVGKDWEEAISQD